MPLPLRRELAALVQKDGDLAVSTKLHVARLSIVRALAGCGMRRGTILQFEAALRGAREAKLRADTGGAA